MTTGGMDTLPVVIYPCGLASCLIHLERNAPKGKIVFGGSVLVPPSFAASPHLHVSLSILFTFPSRKFIEDCHRAKAWIGRKEGKKSFC